MLMRARVCGWVGGWVGAWVPCADDTVSGSLEAEEAIQAELRQLRVRVAALRDAERERDALRTQLDEVRMWVHVHVGAHACL
jgi:hypothetical protein